MKIDNSYQHAAVKSKDTASAAAKTSSTEEEKKVSTEETSEKKSNVDTMDFSKSSRRHSKGVDESSGIYNRSALSIKNEAMKEMVTKLISGQAAHSSDSSTPFTSQINDLLKQYGISPVEHNDAEDENYWSAESTANRILDFAKSLAGSNEAMFEKLKGAFETAFGQCEKIWGGKLPDVCYNTQELVLKGFDEIAQSFKKTAEETTDAAEKTTATTDTAKTE